MAATEWRGGENDGGGGRDRENDGGGRYGGPCGPAPLVAGPLPGWANILGSSPPHKALYGGRFPESGWDPQIALEMIVAGFAAEKCWLVTLPPPPGHPGSTPILLPRDPAPTDPAEAAKLALIQDVAALREVLQHETEEGEIEFQAGDIISYYRKLLACSPEVRPNTDFLLALCIRVAAHVARHYKKEFMRARPAQVVPWLATRIPTPRHPSYPSAHALQVFLIAEAVGVIAKGKVSYAKQIAERIARNRETAGVHFPSDTAASRGHLAETVWTCLAAFSTVPDLIRKATLEHPAEEALDLPLLAAPSKKPDVDAPPKI